MWRITPQQFRSSGPACQPDPTCSGVAVGRILAAEPGNMHPFRGGAGPGRQRIGHMGGSPGTADGQGGGSGPEDRRRIIGWCEWVSLPGLGIPAIRAKLDTGAKTSALHAWDPEPCEVGGEPGLRFRTQAVADGAPLTCEAALLDRRWVANSGGMRELRYVITTRLAVGGESWAIELTLTQRHAMGFRMLVGREAMRGRLVVDPAQSYRCGRRRRRTGRPVAGS